MTSDNRRWDSLGKADPYWAVCFEPRYRVGSMTADDRRDFFDSGVRDVVRTMQSVRDIAGDHYRPKRALDFGCGVGRLTLPIARLSESAIGVDLSAPMLDEARRNSAEQQVGNTEWLLTSQLLADRTRTFDFIHSYIVFQHIPPKTGMAITAELLRRLEPGGYGALHYKYARRASVMVKALNRLRHFLPPLDMAIKLVRRQPLSQPSVPMHEYNLAQLLDLLQRNDCTAPTLHLTDHGGHLGCMMVFRKEP